MINVAINPRNDEWVKAVGRYILNMGVVEELTRVIIMRMTGKKEDQIINGDLSIRIRFIRGHYPRSDHSSHQEACRILDFAVAETSFRNIVAHSPVMYDGDPHSSESQIGGILNVMPRDKTREAELVSLAELQEHVGGAVALANDLNKMMDTFATPLLGILTKSQRKRRPR